LARAALLSGHANLACAALSATLATLLSGARDASRRLLVGIAHAVQVTRHADTGNAWHATGALATAADAAEVLDALLRAAHVAKAGELARGIRALYVAHVAVSDRRVADRGIANGPVADRCVANG
jgi:hypothetical protein